MKFRKTEDVEARRQLQFVPGFQLKFTSRQALLTPESKGGGNIALWLLVGGITFL